MNKLPEDMDGEVALVTGGTKGIGRATSRLLAARGATVVANYHTDETAATKTADELSSLPGETTIQQFDVGDYDAVKESIEEIEAEFGKVSILVNNAGIMRNELLLRMDPEDWHDVIETNLTGTFNCTRAVARSMILGNGGRIVCIGSIAGQRGWAGQSNYAASKAGIVGFVRSLARELGDRNVRINAVAPGYTQTDLFDDLADDLNGNAESIPEVEGIPEGRVADPEEVAEAICYLASDRASYVTGEVLRVDGGLLS